MKIVIDSYAWIELFMGSAKGGKIKEILENADEIYTPDTVLAEIARKYVREGIEQRIVNTRLEQIVAASNITYLDAKLSLQSAKCYLELAEGTRKTKLNSPSLFDAIVLATGRMLKAKILTGDEHFKFLPDTIWI
ncbi:MAG: PIN domain-containing protein [Candidatus Bathyarchaeota archaeon]|nr:PIN domain-containing protein [Candidatus Bathyarchaeota archaeon]